MWSAALAVVFLWALAATSGIPFRRSAVLWFPDARAVDDVRPRAELRLLPVRSSVESGARRIVEEMLLGPADALAAPVSVSDARVRSVIRSGSTLYVDVGPELLFGRTGGDGITYPPPLSPRTALAFIEKTLSWNFPWYTIIMTVGGHEPGWSDGVTELR